MLAYLAATGRAHLREMLCQLLWDGPDDPRAELRWCLSKIRPLLDAGGGQLTADRERVCFVPGPVRVDSAVVRTLLTGGVETASTETLRAAAGLFRGEPLEALDLPACYRFHEWCVGEREALRGLRTAAVAELVARLAAADRDLPEALRWARQRVTFDPLAEAAHIDVIRILGRLGRTREALAQYDSCRRILETELGAGVSSALERARRALSTAQPPHADPGNEPGQARAALPAAGLPDAADRTGRDSRGDREPSLLAARDGGASARAVPGR